MCSKIIWNFSLFYTLAFLNLESVGSNGKEILFQSGPNHGWLIDVSEILKILRHFNISIGLNNNKHLNTFMDLDV